MPFQLILAIVIVILELFRLPNGFYGNLRQSFPEILAFFILTLFSTVLVFVLLIVQFEFAIPTEFALLVVQALFLVGQLVTCLLAMGSLSDAQTALFFWRNPLNTLKMNYRKGH